MLGWYGGFGFFGTMGFFTETMHLPWMVALLVIVGEFFGSLGLIAELLTRFTATSFMVIMLGAITTSHLPAGARKLTVDETTGAEVLIWESNGAVQS